MAKPFRTSSATVDSLHVPLSYLSLLFIHVLLVFILGSFMLLLYRVCVFISCVVDFSRLSACVPSYLLVCLFTYLFIAALALGYL